MGKCRQQPVFFKIFKKLDCFALQKQRQYIHLKLLRPCGGGPWSCLLFRLPVSAGLFVSAHAFGNSILARADDNGQLFDIVVLDNGVVNFGQYRCQLLADLFLAVRGGGVKSG